jgi:hypothetical protein
MAERILQRQTCLPKQRLTGAGFRHPGLLLVVLVILAGGPLSPVMAAVRNPAAEDLRLQPDPRRIPALFDEAVEAWVHNRNNMLAARASALLEQEQSLSPLMRQYVLYWKVRVLLVRGRADDLVQVNDVVGQMQAGDPLTVLAYAGLILQADQQQMKPALLAFLLQRLADTLAVNNDTGKGGGASVSGGSVANAAAVAAAGSVEGLLPLTEPLRLLVFGRLLAAGLVAEATEVLAAMDIRYGGYAAAVLRLAMQPLATGPLPQALAWPQASPDQRWTPALRDQRQLEIDSLRRLGSETLMGQERRLWNSTLHDHLLAIRSWQSPRLLRDTSLLWRGKLLIPDSPVADESFREFVGCDGADNRVKHCSAMALEYLYPVFGSKTLRETLVGFNDLAQSNTGLQDALAELEWLIGQQSGGLADDDQDGQYSLLDDNNPDTDSGQDFNTGLSHGEREYPLSELKRVSVALAEHVAILEQQQRDELVQQILLALAERRQHLAGYGRQLRAAAGIGVLRQP